jgi:hypothetical protein
MDHGTGSGALDKDKGMIVDTERARPLKENSSELVSRVTNRFPP